MTTEYRRLEIRPTTFKEAKQYIADFHRHHSPPVGHKFSIKVVDPDTNEIVGVAMCGRPVARGFDPNKVLEVNRLCTDGSKNACSILYAASARIAQSMGYEQIITYILETEPGTSLTASGWTKEATTAGGSWACPSRPRDDKAPTCKKHRYVRVFKK